MKNISDIDEIIAFYEENGFSYTEEQKEEIRQKTAEIMAKAGDRELSEEELESAAGGWSWSSFFTFGSEGALAGAVLGLVLTVSNPVGWVVGGMAAGAIAGGAIAGSIAGATEA